MTEELLKTIKRELEEEKAYIAVYNDEARKLNKRTKEERDAIKLSGGRIQHLYIDRRTDSEILLKLLRKYRNIIREEDTNRIYVYCGTYREKNDSYEDGPEDMEVDYNDKSAAYSIYKNLEIDREIIIPIDERDEFERDAIIITGNYKELQKEFIKVAAKKGQSMAVKRMVKSYRRSYNYED